MTKQALANGIPLFLPAIPFALVLGLTTAESEMATWIGWLGNPLIFAGAAQLAIVSLAGSASWFTVVGTAIVINLRHTMYSAAFVPRFQSQPRWFRWLGPIVLIDQLFALTVERTELDPVDFRRYYLRLGALFYLTWQPVVVLGIFLGDAIPASWRLDVAPAVMFLGIVVLGISTRSSLVAALISAAATILALDLPNNLGLLVGALTGIVAGYLTEPKPEPAPDTGS